MTLSVVHWDTWDDGFVFSMHEEDILEQTSVKYRCVHFSQLEDQCVTKTYTSYHYWTYSCKRTWTPKCHEVTLMVKLLIIIVSCNLKYASKKSN